MTPIENTGQYAVGWFTLSLIKAGLAQSKEVQSGARAMLPRQRRSIEGASCGLGGLPDWLTEK